MSARLAVFPKCYLDALVVERSMSLFDWIEMAATLPHVEGLELYPPAFESFEPDYLARVRSAIERHGLQMPMMCASPDFVRREPRQRREEIERYQMIIGIVAALGGATCRILSGQRQPDVARDEGIRWVVDAIKQLLPHAERHRVVLVMENHYKDGYWQYPEFAQRSDVFLEIVEQIDSPWFGINYDPSNAVIAGEDPYALLDAVKHRVVSMHASDRSLEGGTLSDLQRFDVDPLQGYAPFVRHGVIGEGLIDYDRIFSTLYSAGFQGWISIEDGQDPLNGMDHLRRSAAFLHAKMVQHKLMG